MYGGLAHANEDKEPRYREWMKGEAAPIMQFLFEDIAAQILQRAGSYYMMNQRTIAVLEAIR